MAETTQFQAFDIALMSAIACIPQASATLASLPLSHAPESNRGSLGGAGPWITFKGGLINDEGRIHAAYTATEFAGLPHVDWPS